MPWAVGLGGEAAAGGAAGEAGGGGSPGEDVGNGAVGPPFLGEVAVAVNAAERRAGGEAGGRGPGAPGADRARRQVRAAGQVDQRAGAVLVGFRPADVQAQAVVVLGRSSMSRATSSLRRSAPA
ncbi:MULTISPECIES: hypothetical protein [unclassified Frankia]|uniref:hypothetical protein n=1 Tax=unclassified Frankia TaxID=2632575 RepID=UPI002AD20F5D|nr:MULTISPECIES: hypothetical protein [unclassified Frankia]